MRNLFLILLTALSSISQADNFSPFSSQGPLPAIVTNPQSVTLSGISAGAFFAVQYGMAHSSEVQGVASLAGGIYHCAENSLEEADSVCAANPGNIDVTKYVSYAQRQAAANTIDPLSSVAKQKIFIYQGTQDVVINPLAAGKLAQFYTSLGAQVQSKTDVPSGHGFPTKSFGNVCSSSDSPWILKCDYDAAGDILNDFYGPLAPSTPMKAKNLISFDQGEFAVPGAGMESIGYVYIPDACRATSGSCRLHVAFHGCMQTPISVGDAFVAKTGLNDWAESNNIVVLYPVVAGAEVTGCWDWYGYTGDDYDLASAKQITVIHKMIARLQGQK